MSGLATVNAEAIAKLMLRVSELERRTEALRRPVAVVCPDCGHAPCAMRQDDGLLLVHCGHCGPGAYSIAILVETEPWESSWNRLISDTLLDRLKEQPR